MKGTIKIKVRHREDGPTIASKARLRSVRFEDKVIFLALLAELLELTPQQTEAALPLVIQHMKNKKEATPNA